MDGFILLLIVLLAAAGLYFIIPRIRSTLIERKAMNELREAAAIKSELAAMGVTLPDALEPLALMNGDRFLRAFMAEFKKERMVERRNRCRSAKDELMTSWFFSSPVVVLINRRIAQQ